MRKITWVAFVACLLALPLLAQAPGTDPTKVDHTTGEFHGCAPTGDASLTLNPQDQHQSDPYLNALKNRDQVPANFTSETVPAIIADKPAAPRHVEAS